MAAAAALIDHKITQDPYLSKFEKEESEKRIRKIAAINKLCCLKEWVTYIVEQSNGMFKGTDKLRK